MSQADTDELSAFYALPHVGHALDVLAHANTPDLSLRMSVPDDNGQTMVDPDAQAAVAGDY